MLNKIGNAYTEAARIEASQVNGSSSSSTDKNDTLADIATNVTKLLQDREEILLEVTNVKALMAQ